MRFEVGRCRNLYVSGDIGIGMLPGPFGPLHGLLGCCTAESSTPSRRGYDVFTARVSVPAWQKVAMTGRAVSGR